MTKSNSLAWLRDRSVPASPRRERRPRGASVASRDVSDRPAGASGGRSRPDRPAMTGRPHPHRGPRRLAGRRAAELRQGARRRARLRGRCRDRLPCGRRPRERRLPRRRHLLLPVGLPHHVAAAGRGAPHRHGSASAPSGRAARAACSRPSSSCCASSASSRGSPHLLAPTRASARLAGDAAIRRELALHPRRIELLPRLRSRRPR